MPRRVLANGFQAAAFATGLPSLSDIKELEAGHANVQSALNPANGATIIGAVDLATRSRNSTSIGSQTLSSEVIFNLRTSMLTNPQQLRLGLLDATTTDGSGFQQLTFSIEIAGVTFETDHFSTLAGAATFFQDHVIDLGDIDTSGSFLSLRFTLTLNSTGGGNDSFNGRFLVAAVPEPSIWVLTALGMLQTAAVLSRWRRNNKH